MAKFDIYQDIAGGWRWRLIARNGEIVASGEAYVSRLNALAAVRMIAHLAPTATIRLI